VSHPQIILFAGRESFLSMEGAIPTKRTAGSLQLELTLKTMEEVGSVVFNKVQMKTEGSIRDSWG
jgi:hypothetical protein